MKEFFPEIDISQETAEIIARGLYSIARADGVVHPGEVALINELYAAATDHPAAFGALDRIEDISPADLATHLPGESLRHLFLETAMLMAHADGTYGKGEDEKIRAYGKAFGVSDDTLDELHTRVKEYLVSQLTHLANIDAVAAVKRELDQ